MMDMTTNTPPNPPRKYPIMVSVGRPGVETLNSLLLCMISPDKFCCNVIYTISYDSTKRIHDDVIDIEHTQFGYVLHRLYDKCKSQRVQQSLYKCRVLISRPSEQHTKRYKCDYIAIEIQKYTHWRHLIPVCDKPLYFLQRVKIVSAFIISPSAKHIAENKKVNDTDYIKHKQQKSLKAQKKVFKSNERDFKKLFKNFEKSVDKRK